MLAKNDAKGRKQHLQYLATNIWVVLHKKIHLRGPWKGEIQAFSCENEHKQLHKISSCSNYFFTFWENIFHGSPRMGYQGLTDLELTFDQISKLIFQCIFKKTQMKQPKGSIT